MDRNGKKKKARPDPAAAHAERSDTKAHERDTIVRMQADAKQQRQRGGGDTPAASGSRKGNRA